ncbi:MAG TPA: PQQ-binding-like beta-propeller repeat protein [Gemmataceae bacterium]|nr:PQQ-binding-like beta-propeller repeat protein [Gemmataceae bacterium]
MKQLRAALPVVWLAGPTLLAAQEWTRFRGPNGSGLSAAAAIPSAFTEADYHWKIKLPGVGHSSPVLWGERLFVTSGEEADGKRLILCLDAATGKRLWSRTYTAARHPKHSLNSLASITPAVDANHVYLCWPAPKEFLVIALDHQGKEAWRADLGPFRAGHGPGASPIVHAGLLIVPRESDGDSCLVALDRRTGQVRWKVPRAKEGSWSTPCVFQRKDGSADLIVTNYRQGIVALDPETGRQRWGLDVFDKRHVESSIGSPIVTGDLVLGVCGWLGVRQEVVAVRPDATGRKAEKLYAIQRSAPLCTTPLVKDGLLFLWSDEGIVSCAEVTTGKVHWRERLEGTFYASPVCVGERLYNVNTNGDVYVLAAAKEFKQLARNALGEGTHSTPAVAGGRMYLRTFSGLISLGGKCPHGGQ